MTLQITDGPDVASIAAPRICGFGDMADRIRAMDWSATPLGPLSEWSESLVMSVNMLLSAPSTFAIYWGEARTLIYNDAYRALLHEKHPAALGKSGPEVWSEAWDLIGPQIQAAYEQGSVTKVSQGMIPIMVGDRLEDRWFSYSFHPIYEGGRIVAVGNPGQDDTATVEASAALRHREAELNQVLGATADAIVGVNREWKITYVNAAAVRTYGADRELAGKYLWKEFPEAVYDGSPFVEHYNRAMYEGKAGSFEAHYPEPLNLWIQLEVYPTAEGFVTFSRDNSARRRAEAALLQTEKLAAVGRLASSIAHEINNPLEAVTNLLYLARRANHVAVIRPLLDSADEELRRVAVITNQTLRFHKQSSRPQDITCLDLFSSVLQMHEGKLRNWRIVVEKRKRANKPVKIYEGDIRQVLNNLVSNAIDAMPQGGRLLVRSREATSWRTGQKGLMLTIADNGTGIAPEIREKVFEAFYTTKGIGGTGLGLWISKDIVERHHGTLAVRSSQRELHRGTVFCLFLPFNAAQ